MRILIDSDVLLDVGFERKPHHVGSSAVLSWCEQGGQGLVAYHSLSNCAYMLKSSARPFLKHLLAIVDVASVSTADARIAVNLPMADLEDALQAAAALACGADLIVTRNLADYRRSPVRAVSPAQFLKRF